MDIITASCQSCSWWVFFYILLGNYKIISKNKLQATFLFNECLLCIRPYTRYFSNCCLNEITNSWFCILQKLQLRPRGRTFSFPKVRQRGELVFRSMFDSLKFGLRFSSLHCVEFLHSQKLEIVKMNLKWSSSHFPKFSQVFRYFLIKINFIQQR